VALRGKDGKRGGGGRRRKRRALKKRRSPPESAKALPKGYSDFSKEDQRYKLPQHWQKWEIAEGGITGEEGTETPTGAPSLEKTGIHYEKKQGE